MVAGPRQPASVHAIAALINQSLGSDAVSYVKTDAANSGIDALKSLAGEMSSGQVSTLFILGGNPAYTAPADLQFATALAKVAELDSSGSRRRRNRGRREVARAGGAFP